MGEKMDLEKKIVVTPEFRVSFPYVLEPRVNKKTGEVDKYSMALLFSKKTDLKELRRAAFNAALEKFGCKEKIPKNLRLTFRDGNEKSDLQGYENTIFVNATSKKKPTVVDEDLNPILDKETFYAGCYARAQLCAFYYDVDGNKGISFGLWKVQKTKDGEPFGGGTKVEDVFEKVARGSEDESNYDSDASGDAGLSGF